MSSDARTPRASAPRVLARRAGSGRVGPAVLAGALAEGAALVEVDLEDLAALDPVVVPQCVAVVEDLDGAGRALDLGVRTLRLPGASPDRDALVDLAGRRGAVVHVPFGRGAPVAAVLDVGELDADAGDDLVGRLAALTDLAAAGRAVIASIGPVGPDDTAALAALATARGASVLRVHDVAAAVRAAAVQTAIAGAAGGAR